jgi:hypothetical protein
VVPGLAAGAYAFGLLQIVWFAWLGIVLMRTSSRRSESAIHEGVYAASGSRAVA